MFIAILGRQPEISFAELEAVFGRQNVQPATPDIATIDADDIDLLSFELRMESRLCGHGGRRQFGRSDETVGRIDDRVDTDFSDPVIGALECDEGADEVVV